MAEVNSPRITGRGDLIQWLQNGETPRENWRIGTEHEKFLFDVTTNRRPGYDGASGVGALLTALNDRLGGTAIMEGDAIIGVKEVNGGSLTLEPGGQFELSGAPLATLHETCRETNSHLKIMREVTATLGLGMLGVGYDPKWPRDDVPWMPKGRYKIMRAHMPKVGTLGLDMMQRTSTIQVNLDYSDERDMARKFRTSLALQPVATALFANSPFKEGKPSGLLSTRAQAWTDTDNARCGVPACVFDDGFGYEQWVDYILDVPMYFLHRGDDYADVAGLSFRDYMAGQLPGYEGELPVMADWEDHITTAFPEVRLKQYLEMRGADGGPWNMICALPALWVGLLYDAESLDAAEELARGLTAEDVAEARMSAATHGLNGQIGGRNMLELGRQMVAISGDGLKRRNNIAGIGDSEVSFLDPLKEIVQSGITKAERLLDHYHNDWSQEVDPIYRDFQF
ncbi:MAG: glutamate--cysteine ligase [Alphaproteobacteria bacterium]|nr:glutamate--cysteine ligase [Alphaproteobacteria bacterium]